MNFSSEFLLKALKLIVGTALNQGGIALVLGGLAIVNGWLPYVVITLLSENGHNIVLPETPLWLPMSLVVLGAALLVFGRLFPELPLLEKKPNPHDIELLRDFRLLVTPQVIDFVRSHNFGNMFLRTKLDGLAEIADVWRGAHFEFQDPELQTAFRDILKSNEDFMTLVVEHTFASDRNPAFSTVLTFEDRDFDLSKSTRDAIKRLNESGTKLAAAIDAFEKLARSRLPVPKSAGVAPT